MKKVILYSFGVILLGTCGFIVVFSTDVQQPLLSLCSGLLVGHGIGLMLSKTILK